VKTVKRIQWTNKYSGEVGYVKTVSAAKKCFINTFDKDEARKFRSDAEAEKTIAVLNDMGEGENNIFTIVE
jgi:hypothetical protein